MMREGFLWEKEENKYTNRKKEIPIGANKPSYSLAIHG